MKIEDILQALPSKEDIASAIGREAPSSATGDMLTAFGIFGTGLILGAGLALLFAPKAGHEIRHDIAEKVNREIVKMVRRPDMVERLRRDGLVAETYSLDAFRKFIAAETARWKPMLIETGFAAH